MVCMNCHWWRPAPDTPTDDDGIPHYGRCVARPPEPVIFAVEDREKWNNSEMLVAGPQTLPTDHCAAHVPRDLVDQQTGRLKTVTAPPGHEDDEAIH